MPGPVAWRPPALTPTPPRGARVWRSTGRGNGTGDTAGSWRAASPGDARNRATGSPTLINVLRTTDQPDVSPGGLDRAATTSPIPPAHRPFAGRHPNPLATRYLGVWECDARQGGAIGPTAPARSGRVASPGMLQTGLATTASLPPRRTSPTCCDLVRVGGLALDGGNRAG